MALRKTTPLTTRKAGIKKHVEENRRAVAGRKVRPTLRVYENAAGETFTVKRTYSGCNLRGLKEKSFSVEINRKGTGPFARARLEIHQSPQISAIDGREIYIFDIITNRHHENPADKKGREVFGMVLDECKQLGKKEFGKKPYYITLIANNEKTALHYHNFGFEFASLIPLKMRLRVN